MSNFCTIAHNNGMANAEDLMTKRNREDKEQVFGPTSVKEERQ